MGVPKTRGTFLGVPGPHNKDYSILGSILGSPDFEKLPCAWFRGFGGLGSMAGPWCTCEFPVPAAVLRGFNQ